ncbi:hypothetical protein R3P38DRAFT_3168856 [Favolaschia claudopus]|uniref:JmjC domain-containing protein n=1 Tax=Favolaschia claudopus TaxID=2862362 RepID=A0AAW0E0A1_9AGAR
MSTTQTSFETSLFQMPGPWDHATTAAISRAGLGILPDPESLAAKFEGYSATPDFYPKLIRNILWWSRFVLSELTDENRTTVMWGVDITSYKGYGVSNPTTSPATRHGVLPVLALDKMLFALDPSPAEPEAAQQSRPATSEKHRSHFYKTRNWYKVLVDAWTLHKQALENEQPDPADIEVGPVPKKEVLARLRHFFNYNAKPWDIPRDNMYQAATMLQAMQAGHMKLDNKERFIDILWRRVLLEDETVTREEVANEVINPKFDGPSAALAVAVSISPIYLISGHGYANQKYNPGRAIHNSWKALGNHHHVHLNHPLGRIERVIWTQLIRVAGGLISEWEALKAIFQSDEVQSVLKNRPAQNIIDALTFVYDAPETISPMSPEEQALMIESQAQREAEEKQARVDQHRRQWTLAFIAIVQSHWTNQRRRRAWTLDFVSIVRGHWARQRREQAERRRHWTLAVIQIVRQRWALQRWERERKEDPHARWTLEFIKIVRRHWELQAEAKKKPRNKSVTVIAVPDRMTRSQDPALQAKAAAAQARAAAAPVVPLAKAPTPKASASKAVPSKVSVAPSSKSDSAPKPAKSAYINVVPSQDPTSPDSLPRRSLNLEASRPMDDNGMTIVLHAPGVEPGTFVSREFHYDMFKKCQNDHNMIDAMLRSQPRGPDNKPIFLQASARNPDPRLRPSDTQSVFFVCSQREYKKLPGVTRHQIHRHRCVLVLDVDTEDPPPPFDWETMQQYRDPDELCPVQDMGLNVPDASDCLVRAPLSALLPRPDRPVLNAIHHPLPHQQFVLPPGLASFCSIAAAFTFIQNHRHLPVVPSPWNERRWGLWATAMARTAAHQDIAATEMTVITGAKLVAIGVPRADRYEATGYQADPGSRFSFMNWEEVQIGARTDVYRWEIFLLQPNMAFYMRAGTPHFVISIEDTIAQGLHSVNAAQIQPTVFNILHNVVTEGFHANAEPLAIQWSLVRMLIYWAEIIPRQRPIPAVHFPNVGTADGLLDLLTLISYVVLYPALFPASYAALATSRAKMGSPTTMSETRYREYEVALHSAVYLERWIDLEFNARDITDNTHSKAGNRPRPPNFMRLASRCIVNMAACLVRYHAAWVARSKAANVDVAPGFTATAFKQQLRRAMAAYQHHREHSSGVLQDFAPQTIVLEECEMTNDFDEALEDATKEWKHFMPWDLDSRAMPYIMRRRPAVMQTTNKRPGTTHDRSRKKAKVG